MTKGKILVLMLVAILVASGIGMATARTVGVHDVFQNRETGELVRVSLYNHDNTVYKGPEYQAKVLELLADGYRFLGTSVTTVSGASTPQFREWEEFDKTVLTMEKTSNDGNYTINFSADSVDVNGEVWNFNGDYETGERLEDIVLGNIEFKDRQFEYTYYKEGTSGTATVTITSTGGGMATVTLTTSSCDPTINIDISKIFQDINVEGIRDGDTWTYEVTEDGNTKVTINGVQHTDYDDQINWGLEVHGEEIWKEYREQIPQAPPSKTMQPKNYGHVLNQPYARYGMAEGQEIPEELTKYAQFKDGKILTYTDSPLYHWFMKEVYSPNHLAHLEATFPNQGWNAKRNIGTLVGR